MWTNGRSQKTFKKLFISELSSLNFDSSVRAERSFAICYSIIVIKSLCDNLDVCLNYHANTYFQSRNFVRVISNRDRKREMLFKSRFSVTLRNSFADFRFRNRNPFQSWTKMSTPMRLLRWMKIRHSIQSNKSKCHKQNPVYSSGQNSS